MSVLNTFQTDSLTVKFLLSFPLFDAQNPFKLLITKLRVYLSISIRQEVLVHWYTRSRL